MSSYDALARANSTPFDAPEQQAFDFAELYPSRGRRALRHRRTRLDPEVPGEAYIHTPTGDRYRLDVWFDADLHQILRYRLQRIEQP